MAIRIERNEAGNCINFHGASNPTYWNACLSGEVDIEDTGAVNVINDIITAQTGVTEYEYYRVPFTEFVDADGNAFADAQDAADYITEKANVIGLSGEGIDLTGETVCFSLDATSTSIMLDTGHAFGVNTIKANANADGTIHIVSNDGADDITHFHHLDATNTCVNGNPVSGGLQDVVNTLNELFTVGAFESIVIADPYSTMVADVSGVSTTTSYVGYGIDPIGTDVYGSTNTNSQNGYKTVETIDQAGEYFTFDIRVEGTIGFGLVHSQDSYNDGYWSGNSTYADPTTFGVSNSGHSGFQFSHWFHPTPNGSWTNYGANTGYSMRAGWSNFNGTDEQADWLAGNPIKVRVGIDTNGYISIDTLRNGTDWVVHARTSYPIVDGAEFHLGIKTNHTGARVHTLPKVHLLEPAAPTMYFRYAESPDNVFKSPLFLTTEEAEYYDTIKGGSGTYTTLNLPDDPTNTLWYVPDTEYTGNGVAAPSGNTFEGNSINWTEITTQTNADLVPISFSNQTVTVSELSSVNIQVHPQGASWNTNIVDTDSSGLLLDNTSFHVYGTAPAVTGDNVANPSDSYEIEIVRSNSYGSSSGILTVVVENLTAPIITPITGFTHNASSTALASSSKMDSGSVITMDEDLKDLERFIILKSYVETNILPSILATGGKYYIGVLNSGANVSSVEDADWDVAFVWEYQTPTTHKYRVIKDGVQQWSVGIGSNTSALFDYAIESHDGHVHMIACNANAINTEPSPEFGGTFTNATEVTLDESYPLTISMAYVGSDDAKFETTGLSEIVTPLPDDFIQVTANPSHTLLFDGQAAIPTLQAGYTYRFMVGDTKYSDLSTSTGLHADDDLRFTADGITEYTTGITRVGNPNDVDTFGMHTAYVEFTVPSNVPPLQWYTDHNGIGSATGITISGSTYVVPVTGVTIEGPTANFTGNVINSGSNGWISLNEQLHAGERLVLDSAFLQDLNSALPDNCIFWVGLKDSSWSNTSTGTGAFKGSAAIRFYNTASATEPGLRMLGYANGGVSSQLYTASVANANAFIEITGSGNNIRLGYTASTSYNASSTTYGNWDGNSKVQTGEQGYGISGIDVVIYWQAIANNTVGFDISDVDFTGLTEINIPTPTVTNDTSWTKALDFSGSNEHTKQVASWIQVQPLQMGGLANTVDLGTTSQGDTSNNTSARPWATAVVFKSDGYSGTQMIWNQGEGSSNGDDNISLVLGGNGELSLQWGRQGTGVNKCRIAQNISSSNWYGISIAHNGVRLGGNNASASNLANCFNIRLMSSADSFVSISSNLSTSANWVQTGQRMDRTVAGDFTIGGRGSGYSFRGKVASMVVTTLLQGGYSSAQMPEGTMVGSNQAKMMITDPVKWVATYKVRLGSGNPNGLFRKSAERFATNYYTPTGAYQSTLVWLMGDGASDSYSNGVRNYIYPSDQNSSKMQLNSMVSNDIENVNISGLS